MCSSGFVGSVTNPVTFDATLHTTSTGETPAALLSFDFSRRKEDGHITISSTDTTFSVSRKDEVSSWKMTPCTSFHNYSPLVAYKEQWWRRNFDITMDGCRYIMNSVGACRADYVVQRVEREVEVIGRKVHGQKVGELKMTSRKGWNYDVKFDEDVGEALPAFCFWLVTLMNRRRTISEVAGWHAGQDVESTLAKTLMKRLGIWKRGDVALKEEAAQA